MTRLLLAVVALGALVPGSTARRRPAVHDPLPGSSAAASMQPQDLDDQVLSQRWLEGRKETLFEQRQAPAPMQQQPSSSNAEASLPNRAAPTPVTDNSMRSYC